MVDDQRTVGAGSGGSSYEPTRLAGDEADSGSGYQPTQLAGSEGIDDHPTPQILPAKNLDGWPPSPPSPPDPAPFRPTSDQASASPAPPPEATGGKTMLMRTEPEPQIPLAWLAVVEGPGGKRGAVFTLKSETIVGRTYGDLVLGGDSTVSSQHIKVRLETREEQEAQQQEAQEEIFVLYDLASANGTFVGNKQTYRDEDNRIYRRELQDGDYILVGETTLVFKQI